MKKEEEYGGDSTKEYIAWEEAHTKGSRFVYTRGTAIHAENKIAGGFIPFLVLGFWDENTGFPPAPCHIAGIFRPLPGSRHFKLNRGYFVSRGPLRLAW